MGNKTILFFASLLLIISLLGTYWFIPFDNTYFISGNQNTNFSDSNSSAEQMQFYPNLRFLSPNISYRIEECPLNKKAEMEQAFEIISNKTILSFYPVTSGENILTTCQSRNKFEGDLFIAGEGGPINITSAGKYNVIYHGAILLIRESKCETPNIAIHELLHVLGFEHSSNQGNVMYNISKCGQQIGEDVLMEINRLYSIPAYPDIIVDEVSASMHGRYLNSNFSVKNLGLNDSEKLNLTIYVDGKKVEEVGIDALKIGTGMKISLQNIFVNKFEVKEIRFFADYPLEELEKNNNEIILKVKS